MHEKYEMIEKELKKCSRKCCRMVSTNKEAPDMYVKEMEHSKSNPNG